MPTAEKLTIKFHFTDSKKVFQLDLLDITVQEQMLLEEIFDRPFGRLDDDGWLFESATGLCALACVARRRREPGFTYEQSRELFEKADEVEEPERPTAAAKKTGSPS